MESIVNESVMTHRLNEQLDVAVTRYNRNGKYREMFEELRDNSMIAKTRGVNDYDYFVLGKQLDEPRAV